MYSKLINNKAPSFTLPSSEGKPISLKDYKDQMVVVYFYPKNETSGCTIEAMAFKNFYWEFLDIGAIILGISPDEIKSHCKFADKLDLPFPLLSDSNHEAAKDYGIWKQKTMYGKEYWGFERTTFIIDKGGVIRLIIEDTKPDEHPVKALQFIKENLIN